MITFLDILGRANTGPVCRVRDWDIRIVPEKILQKLKEHGLEKTCQAENPINTDDGLADDFWEAGFRLATEIGMLCQTTERIIKITEEELKSAIEESPREVSLGEGVDRIFEMSRKPEDVKPITTELGPFGNTLSEDLFIPICQSSAQHRSIDLLLPGSLVTAYGADYKSGTPYETLGAKLEAILSREAIKRAGRPGMPLQGVMSSTTQHGQLGGFGVPGGYRLTDGYVVLTPAELKTAYELLHKVAHAINIGATIRSASWSMIGGYAGPVEGAALAAIAVTLLQVPIHRSPIPAGQVFDPRYLGNCGRDAIWASSVAHQALARNTHLIIGGANNPVAGPCTDMILYEAASASINCSVSGCGYMVGVRSAGGKYINYTTGLENKFAGEVAKASAGMKRKDANEIVKNIITKYQDSLKRPPKGKSFTECYDVKTLKPNKEWLDKYYEAKKYLADLGLPLETEIESI